MKLNFSTAALGIALALGVSVHASAATTYHYKQVAIGLSAAGSSAPAALPVVGNGTDATGACASGAATGCTTYKDGTRVKLVNTTDIGVARSAICKSTGKWYMEMTYTPQTWGSNTQNGVVGVSTALNGNPWSVFPKYSAFNYIHLTDHPILVTDDVGSAVPKTGVPLHSSVAVLGIALDADAHVVSFMLNGTTQTVQLAAPADACFYFEAATIAAYGTWNGDVNFGQSNFTYMVPAGYNRGWW